MSAHALSPGGYAAIHAASLADRDGFWLAAAQALDWDATPTRAFDPDQGVYGAGFPMRG